MGWTGVPWLYDGFRQSDVKSYLDGSFEHSGYRVLKSTVRRSELDNRELVYYAAVSHPKRPQECFAAVFLACLDGEQMLYKDMTEDVGPNECDCPESILGLLSPTTSEWAMEWRERCHQRNADDSWRRARKIGDTLLWTVDLDCRQLDRGSTVELRKTAAKARYKGRHGALWVAVTRDGERLGVPEGLLNPRNCRLGGRPAVDGIEAVVTARTRDGMDVVASSSSVAYDGAEPDADRTPRGEEDAR